VQPTLSIDPAASGLEHIVVVTMENRSFDHMLGWLPGQRRPVEFSPTPCMRTLRRQLLRQVAQGGQVVSAGKHRDVR
jgi:phospholipase C